MASHLGKLEEFDTTSCDVDTYFERLGSFFRANNVRDNAQVDTFLSVAGQNTYKLLKSLVAPAALADKTLEELRAILKEHVQPKESIIARRAKFYTRVQKDGETVTEYVAQLKQIATDCDFGDFLNQVLRDIFVLGLKDTETQKEIRKVKEPTFKKAVEQALAREALAGGNLRATAPGSGMHGMHKIADRRGNGTRQNNMPPRQGSGSNRGQYRQANGAAHGHSPLCYRCNKAGHTPKTCKYRDYTCRTCSKKGHLQAACRSKTRRSRADFMHSNELEDDDASTASEGGEDAPTLGLFHMPRRSKATDSIRTEINVSGTKLMMEVDTGSACTIIPMDTYETRFQHIPLAKTKQVLKTYSGDIVPLAGQMQVEVRYGEEASHTLTLLVAAVKDQPAIWEEIG